jgi:predicted secreted protein
MTVARIGHGVRLQRASDASPAAFADIGELLEPGGPTLSRDAVEATHSQSPNRYREFISGLRDGGEVTGTFALEPGADAEDNHKKLVDDFNNDNLIEYRLLFPNAEATAWRFDGFITNIEHAEPIDDRMTVAVTFKISGQPTLEDTAS